MKRKAKSSTSKSGKPTPQLTTENIELFVLASIIKNREGRKASKKELQAMLQGETFSRQEVLAAVADFTAFVLPFVNAPDRWGFLVSIVGLWERRRGDAIPSNN